MKRYGLYILTLVSLIALGMPLPLTASEVRARDDTGRLISLSRPAERIVSLYGGFTEVLMAMGLTNKLVARTREDRQPELTHLPSVGSHLRPNVELVLGLKPDLVLYSLRGAEPPPALIQMRRQGIEVASFKPKDFEELFSVIESLGRLTGKNTEALSLVASIKDGLEKVRLATPKGARPTVFFEVRYPNLAGAGSSSFVNDVIKKAGGRNCLTNPKKHVRINIETLIAMKPAFYVVQKGPMNKDPGDPAQRPNFDLIRAVKNNKVAFVDEFLFSRPGPRSMEAVRILNRLLYPESFNSTMKKPDLGETKIEK